MHPRSRKIRQSHLSRSYSTHILLSHHQNDDWGPRSKLYNRLRDPHTGSDCARLSVLHRSQRSDYHRPNTGRIAEQSFAERVRWAFYLYTNNRGIGWAHEPRDLPEGRYTPSTPRWRFVLHQLVFLALSVLVECIAYVCAASNPGMSTPGQSISESPLVWRVIGVVGYGAAGAARINAMYCIASAFVVRIGYSRPDRWLPLFGSPLEGWTIRRFWR